MFQPEPVTDIDSFKESRLSLRPPLQILCLIWTKKCCLRKFLDLIFDTSKPSLLMLPHVLAQTFFAVTARILSCNSSNASDSSMYLTATP
jgi:hypothetical protein